MKILYIHHVKVFGGSSISLTEMIKALQNKGVDVHFIAPCGSAADYWEEKGYPVIKIHWVSYFHHTTIGFYHGMRWLILLRELFFCPLSFLAMIKAKKDGLI